jgi:S-DNA-T family DNA segregation ATPase FtsK/SpoIIIE
VQVYVLDFGGGGLLSLSGLPHVGAVYGRGDGEEARRLVREMQAIVGDRVAAFRQHRVEGMPAYHRARHEGQIPGSRHGEVFLVVDNWAQFAQDFPELEPEVLELAATGLHYGVHLILASNRWNDLRLALRDNMGGRLELRLNDPLDSEIDRHAARALPDRTPGRGIRPGGEQVQIALPRVDGQADAGGLSVGVEGVVAEAGKRWRRSTQAAPVRMLPARVTPAELPDPATDPEPGVAIGIEEFSLGPIHADLFGADPHFLVFGDGECGKTTLLRAWISGLASKYPPDRVRIAALDYRRTLLECVPESHLYGYTCTPEMAQDLASRLATELQGRLPSPGLSAEDLRRRRWWSGPEIALFVDDYDLVAGPTGSPLSGLVELLAQGRDVGFHVVLARRVGGTARSAFEPFLQRIRELSAPGLVMSGDPSEGPIIGEQKAQPLPRGRGYLVRRRRTTLVQTAFVDSEPGRAAEELGPDRAGRPAWRPAS